MYNVFFVVLCADVTCIGYFLMCAVTKERMKSISGFLTFPKLFWIYALL